jgi:hypothetical protein
MQGVWLLGWFLFDQEVKIGWLSLWSGSG